MHIQSFQYRRTLLFLSLASYILCAWVLNGIEGQRNSSEQERAVTKNGSNSDGILANCQCMEYWNCTIKKGQIYSYCGISETEVCCFFNNDEPALETIPNITEKIKSPNPVITEARKSPNPNRTEVIKSPNPDITEVRKNPNPNPKLGQGNSSCGIPFLKGRLDSVAEFKEWPWQVAILEAKDDLFICGASLVSSDRILTAAHCVSSYAALGKRSPRLKIRAGEYDVSSNSESLPHVEVLVHGIILHPKFDNTTLRNDIAVLRLARSISELETRENVLPVCLPKAGGSIDDFEGTTSRRRCVVTGWGRRSEGSQHSIIVKEVIVPLWGRTHCEQSLQSHFGPSYKLPDNSICAGDVVNDACDGDGGGPLVCFSNGVWVQEGIVSFGIGCGRPNSPGVYTRVSSHLDFLKSALPTL